jgi:putative sterol carrier protein
MPVFESDAEAHERLGSLLRAIAADSDLGPKAREADAVVQLSLRAPEATVTADLRAGRGVRVETGSPKLSPDVILAMDGDVAHQLWSGELNPLLALAQGRVRTKGSTAKVLRLVPLFVAAAPRYREWVEGGFPEVAEEEAPVEEAPAPEEPRAEAPAPEAEAVPDAEAAPEAPAAASDEAPAPEESTPAAEPEAPVAPPAGETSAE